MLLQADSRLVRLGTGLAIAAGLAACEYPTQAPRWQTQWQVPAESASLSVKNFLPAGVTVAAGGGAFVVAVPAPGSVNTTLGAVCGAACSAPATVPIPAFNNNGSPIGGSITLPAAATSVTIASGAIDVAVTNNFGFDPIRPAGALSNGSVRIKLTAGAGAITVADTTIGGALSALPVGATTTFRIALRAGTVPGGVFAYQLTVTCPGSTTTAPIAPSQSFIVNPTIVAPGIQVAKATVQLVNQLVSDSSPAFDLTNSKIAPNALQSIGTVLKITNPFQISSSFTLTLTAPGVTSVVKSLTIAPATNDSVPVTSSSTVSFTPAEFQPFMGRAGVRLRYSGNVSGAAAGNTLGVRPTHVMGIQASVLAGVLVGNVP